VPPPNGTTPVPPPRPGSVAKSGAACDLPGGWFFKGACALELVTSQGALLDLPRYRGVAIALAFGESDASGSIPFVAGDAIGDGDVAGRLNGQIPFVGYGRACLNESRTATPCAGKALAYAIVVNGGRTTVAFKASPTIVVSSLHGFPGTSCSIATMVWSGAPGHAAWIVRPPASQPGGTLLRFESRPVPQTYASGGSFTVFAVVCK
jgi:hypothetical protein